MPNTKNRTMRINDELWFATLAEAKSNGETVTDVVKAGMEQYIETSQRNRADHNKSGETTT